MSGIPVVSVIIPSKNRIEHLTANLRALERQSIGDFEVIVIDDGSDDGTSEILKTTNFQSLDLTILSADGKGPAAARNLGVFHAGGQRILLLGDDTIVLPDTIEKHLRAAGEEEIGIQGRIEWDPETEITPLMRYMAPEGPQFFFKGLEDGDAISFARIYGSNFSAPKHWLVEEPFDEHFRHACMEDTEAAWRWRQRGWNFRYAAGALCLHRHHYGNFEQFLTRQRRAGKEARYCIRRHAGLSNVLFFRPLAHLVIACLGCFRENSRKHRWDCAWLRAYFSGWLEGPDSP